MTTKTETIAELLKKSRQILDQPWANGLNRMRKLFWELNQDGQYKVIWWGIDPDDGYVFPDYLEGAIYGAMYKIVHDMALDTDHMAGMKRLLDVLEYQIDFHHNVDVQALTAFIEEFEDADEQRRAQQKALEQM